MGWALARIFPGQVFTLPGGVWRGEWAESS